MSLCKRHGLHPLRNRYCSLFACRLGTSRETREFWPSVFAKLRCAHLDRNNMDGIGGAPLPVCLPFCLQRSGPYLLTMKRGLLHSSPAVRESSTVRTFETVALHTRHHTDGYELGSEDTFVSFRLKLPVLIRFVLPRILGATKRVYLLCYKSKKKRHSSGAIMNIRICISTAGAGEYLDIDAATSQ